MATLAYSWPVKDSADSLPFAQATQPSTVLLSARTCCASPGHFDELRGHKATDAPLDAALTEAWAQFFDPIQAHSNADLDQRARGLRRQIRDDGATYNMYADSEGPLRPWSLDLFPLIIDAPSWSHIEAGIQQRVRLLEAVMADVYGPQTLLAQGLLPPALVHGHPGYLRPLHGVQPVGGTHLHVVAFDLAHGPDGHWWLLGQRCQAPSGLGYLLENRSAVSQQFPQAFQALRVQRLADTYRALVDSLRSLSPAGPDAHIALLTPGPYNETYFEHAYLARYLGLSLVEGSDLLVRDERLFLKTLHGLVPVHGLLKRVDDQYLDPLELRPDSTLGVPGLLQVIRAGHVLVANAPGSAFLESPALLGFLPALARHVLQEELRLPALPTWWCGERSAMEQVLPRLGEHVIKPSYPGSALHGSFDAVLCPTLAPAALDAWRQRIMERGEGYTVQAYMPLSQIPTWQQAPTPSGQALAGHMVARSSVLRVFAVSDAARGPKQEQRWRVLPGGLVRVANACTAVASMQRGGSSADVWALAQGEVDTLAEPPVAPGVLAQHKHLVTRRAAENLYWLGRYTERAENLVRLARLTLDTLNGEEPHSPPLLQWLTAMAVANTLVLPGTPSALHPSRGFERALISSLSATDGATSVGYNLRALKMAAATVRERLSQEHWHTIVGAEEEFFAHCTQHALQGDHTATSALRVLQAASDRLATITGAQTDHLTRDDGWRLLRIGRHVERLQFLAASLARGFETGVFAHPAHSHGGGEAMLALFDSALACHAPSPHRHDVVALVELLVLDRDNPGSLAWVAHTLRRCLSELAGVATGVLSPLSLRVPNPDAWDLDTLCETALKNVAPPALMDLLRSLGSAAYAVSEDIGATYFTHSGQTKQSMGT